MLVEYSCGQAFMLSLAAFLLQWQSWDSLYSLESLKHLLSAP